MSSIILEKAGSKLTAVLQQYSERRGSTCLSGALEKFMLSKGVWKKLRMLRVAFVDFLQAVAFQLPRGQPEVSNCEDFEGLLFSSVECAATRLLKQCIGSSVLGRLHTSRQYSRLMQ